MQQITIPGTSLRTSRFILGTANLFTGRLSATAERFLEIAVDNGFTHFDAAPLYGFGFAERILAPVLRRHGRLTVTTKAGLFAPGGEDQAQIQILARKVIGRAVPSVSRAQADFAVSRARASLTASLTRLGRHHVELFLVHEPDILLMNTDEWLTGMAHEQRSGRIGAFGIAGTKDRVAPFLRDGHPLAAVVQLADSLQSREADILAAYRRPMQITYGYVSSKGSSSSIQDTLAAALARNAGGAIIVSTRRAERLAQYPAALAAIDSQGPAT